MLELENLEYLNLEECYLKSMENICYKKLEYLNLRGNFIHNIPDEFFNATNLKIAFLHQNKIKKLSKKINKLFKLEEFDFGLNNHISIPKELFELKKLKKLNVDGYELSTYFIQALLSYSTLVSTENFKEKFDDIEIFIDFWKSGHYKCAELDYIAMKKLKEKGFSDSDLDLIKKGEIKDIHVSELIIEIEILLKKNTSIWNDQKKDEFFE
eukprot:gene2-4253_t